MGQEVLEHPDENFSGEPFKNVSLLYSKIVFHYGVSKGFKPFFFRICTLHNTRKTSTKNNQSGL